MKYLITISRWLVWLLILSLESVIGLPWVSLWLFGEWFSLSHRRLEQGLVLLLTSIFLATAYQLNLPTASLILGITWLVYGGGGVGGLSSGLSNNRHSLNLRFWSVILFGGLIWWLKSDELQGSWVWWSSVLSWVVIAGTDGQKILWRKSDRWRKK